MAVNKVVYGNQTLIDLSTDTVSSAEHILLGKVGHLRDGTVVTGTASGGGSGEEVSMDDPVRFFDYDGTLVHSYSASDFQALTAMPSNPSHSGLTAQGWNWTLSDAKAQVTAMGTCDIGQMYVTSDGKTRLYCHFDDAGCKPYLGIGVNGTVVIDWGDNTTPDTVTGMSITTVKNTQHVYANGGDYVITLSVSSGEIAFFGSNTTSYTLRKKTTGNSAYQSVCANAVRKVELGDSVKINGYAFFGLYSLSSITIPNSVTSIGTYSFHSCFSLESITIPSSVTSIANYAFNSCCSLESVAIPKDVVDAGSYTFATCQSLKKISIPSGATSLGGACFYNCYSLSNVAIPSGVTSILGNVFYQNYSLPSTVIPSNVTSIAAGAFRNCYGLAEIHFKPTIPPTVANKNAFGSLPSECKIYVPTGYLSDYTSATNYPSSSTYTYIEE